MRPSNATTVLVLGILAWLVCGFLAPVAWIMGTTTLHQMDHGTMDSRDRGLAQAGQILGMVYCILVGLVVLFFLVMTVFFGGMGFLMSR